MKKISKITSFVQVSMFAALMSLCAWISIPSAVPFTMQSFAVFLSAALLGAKKATLAVLIYIILGAVGLPVFSGGQAGVGVLLGQTGGFIIGFLPAAFVCGFLAKWLKPTAFKTACSMAAGLFCIYIMGVLWFAGMYLPADGKDNLWVAFSTTVLPFIIPDILKIALATFVAGRLKRFVK